MPIYEYKCDCGARGETFALMGKAKESIPCKCGRLMNRVFSVFSFNMPLSARDDALNALNNGDHDNIPDEYGGKKRTQELVAKGLERPPKTIW